MEPVMNLSAEFSNILKQYMKAYAKKDSQGKIHYPDMPRITRSSLILQRLLGSATAASPATTSVTFGTLLNDAPAPLATEIRLNQNDEFTITELSLQMCGAVGSATGPATGPLANKYWTYSPLQNLATNDTVLPFWDSAILNLSINNINYILNWDSNQHMVVPRTQFAPLGTVTTSGSIAAPTLDAYKGNSDGFVQMTPTIKLSGAKTNKFTLTFANPLTTVVNITNTSASGTNYYNINTCCIIMRGFLAVNAASFQNQNK